MKFKVGDKVQIIDNICFHSFRIGQVVEIVEVREHTTDYLASSSKASWVVRDPEIKLVEEEKEVAKPKFKVGDKVVVPASVERPSRGWGNVRHGEVGVVTGFRKDGTILVDFPRHGRWCAESQDISLIEPENENKHHNLYVVYDAEGNIAFIETSRKEARVTKKALGGAEQGFYIMQFKASKKVR